MKRIIKKLVIIAIMLVISCVIFLFIKSNMKTKLDETINLATEDTNNIENETGTNIVDSNVTEIPSNIEENQGQIIESPVINQVSESPNEEQTKKESTYEKSNSSKPQETVIPPETVTNQTKEETSNTEEIKTNNPSTNNSNNSSTTNKTTQTNPAPTIKRFTEKEIEDENSKYLADIKSIKPELKCVNKKCSVMQSFYPYRKEEIDIAVGNVTFGTIYYYIEIFVEGNQEKFKYYIGWEGV